MTNLYTEETEQGNSYEKNFWTVVEITRCPKFKNDKPINHSWVFDPLFTDQHTYGLELNLTPKFSMKFILMGSVATYTKADAFIAGIKFRDSLRVRFLGIATKVYIKSMMSSKINKRFWEVKLPSRGYFYKSNINIFQKLINFVWLNKTKRKVVAYIFWKRDSKHKNYPQIPYFEKDSF